MTYFGFLLRFLVPPLVALAALNWWDARRGKSLPPALSARPAWVVMLGLVIVALVYTTPWDNYLVATSIWWYDPARVVGLTLGWVPVEEYCFFVLQTLVTCLWWVWLARRLRLPAPGASGLPAGRWASLAVAGLAWWMAVAVLALGWLPGTYLALEFAWALLPIMLQLGFGADILWRHRRLVALTIIVPTVYLSVADSTAIGAGTWTFSPVKSSGWWVGGLVPIEELFFFALTNTLIGFGMTLVMAAESQDRYRGLVARLHGQRKGRGKAHA